MDNKKGLLTPMQKHQLEHLFDTSQNIDYIDASHNYALAMLKKWFRLGVITQGNYKNCNDFPNGGSKIYTICTASGSKTLDFSEFIPMDELKRLDQQILIHKSARDFARSFLCSKTGDIWKSENKAWSDRQVLRNIETAFGYMGVDSSIFKLPYGTQPDGNKKRLLVTQALKELLEYMLLHRLYKYGTVNKLPKREKVTLRRLLVSSIESFGDHISSERKMPILESFCNTVGLTSLYVSGIHEEVRQALAREAEHRKIPYEKILLYQSDIENIDKEFTNAITALMERIEVDLNAREN